jgi:hypothetical protein
MCEVSPAQTHARLCGVADGLSVGGAGQAELCKVLWGSAREHAQTSHHEQSAHVLSLSNIQLVWTRGIVYCLIFRFIMVCIERPSIAEIAPTSTSKV